MNDLRKAAEMALEALEYLDELDIVGLDHEIQIETLRQALAQPEQDRESDRKRFPDEAFNRWLDEGISDSGHTVWDTVGDISSAWQAWSTRSFYDKAVEQEPVAWMTNSEHEYSLEYKFNWLQTSLHNIPLYTAPPKPEPKSISTNDHLCAMLRQVHDVLACTALPMKRPWVGLTDEEIKGILNCKRGGLVDIKKTEQRLKEKNT